LRYAILLGFILPIASPLASEKNSYIRAQNSTGSPILPSKNDLSQIEGNFTRIDLFPLDIFLTKLDEPRAFEQITLNSDVLLGPTGDLSRRVVLDSEQISLRSFFYVTYYPEKLVLIMKNNGESLMPSAIEVSFTGQEGNQRKLVGYLPPFERNQVLHLLFSASEPIVKAQNLTISVHNLKEYSRR
jgi:hypothetical protein